MRFSFKNLFDKTATKEAVSCWMGISLILLLIRFLGLIQPLEWTFYDFLFFLRPSEPKDERIVIVTWDEDNIREFQEGNISDDKLSQVLQAIKAQQPSIIGLDLYRDVPVASFTLSHQENKQAYQKLKEIFRSTPNLVGIAKFIPPDIKPSKVLEANNRVTSADLIVDKDETIRRAYLYPLGKDRDGNNIDDPTLGLSIAVKYLVDRGFEVGQIKNAMTLTNPQTESKLVLNPLQQFDGNYLKKELGLKILVNWRKGNSLFLRVPISDILTSSISPDTFTNKIVLIGNTSVSSSDKHYLPIDRWKSSNTNGVEIHAHIASSIISAALDERALIKTVPEWLEILILLLSGGSIILVVEQCRQQSPIRIFFIGTGMAFISLVILSAVSLIGFAQGYWIPIVPGLLSSIASPSIICLIIYINKIRQNNEDFRQLIKDINHSLQNYLNSVTGNSNMALSLVRELTEVEPEDLSEALYEYEEQTGEFPFNTLQNNLETIIYLTSNLSQQRQILQEYLTIAFSQGKIFTRQPIAFNEFVHNIVTDVTLNKKKQYNNLVLIQEKYDSKIRDISIDRQNFIRVIENLLDNAYYAIDKKKQNNSPYQGIITVQTKKQTNKVILQISDNGIGMNTETLKQIFLPFFTSKTKNEGQGLGLSLVRETISNHRGVITAESNFGEGSTFTITLPTNNK